MITVGNRKIIPISRMSGYYIDDAYFFLEYVVVAFVIHEDDSTYHVNISLSDEDYENLRNNLLY